MGGSYFNCPTCGAITHDHCDHERCKECSKSTCQKCEDTLRNGYCEDCLPECEICSYAVPDLDESCDTCDAVYCDEHGQPEDDDTKDEWIKEALREDGKTKEEDVKESVSLISNAIGGMKARNGREDYGSGEVIKKITEMVGEETAAVLWKKMPGIPFRSRQKKDGKDCVEACKSCFATGAKCALCANSGYLSLGDCRCDLRHNHLCAKHLEDHACEDRAAHQQIKRKIDGPDGPEWSQTFVRKMQQQWDNEKFKKALRSVDLWPIESLFLSRSKK